MKIGIATDHHGIHLKAVIRDHLTKAGHEVRDFGPDGTEAVDYPDYAATVARAVAAGQCERGILICGTGIGMCIAANKVRGIRAAECWDLFSARRSRQHNDANVLCLGSDMIADTHAQEIVDIWVKTPHEGGRHERRVKKIAAMETEGAKAAR